MPIPPEFLVSFTTYKNNQLVFYFQYCSADAPEPGLWRSLLSPAVPATRSGTGARAPRASSQSRCHYPLLAGSNLGVHISPFKSSLCYLCKRAGSCQGLQGGDKPGWDCDGSEGQRALSLLNQLANTFSRASQWQPVIGHLWDSFILL